MIPKYHSRKLARGHLFNQANRMEKAIMESRPIRVEISVGELIDKITILQIKSERITDERKLNNVRLELSGLTNVFETDVPQSHDLEELMNRLKQVNLQLWDIEDAIRECERASHFEADFVRLARSVYKINDLRSAIKREINVLVGSRLLEEKSYENY